MGAQNYSTGASGPGREEKEGSAPPLETRIIVSTANREISLDYDLTFAPVSHNSVDLWISNDPI